MQNLTTCHVIATQHLDVAWLWARVPAGEDLMRQCLARAVAMVEADPDGVFVFSRSTAWSFWIVQQRAPELFERVRELVRQGRIEVCGGEWVEPDHLIPDGEALVRQAALGQWYYGREFGRTARVCWDPDIFGHPGTVPQILRKAGMAGFYFHRCRPRDEAGTPVQQFVWEGIDGSRVLILSGTWIRRPDRDTLLQVCRQADRTGLPSFHVVTGAQSDRRITLQPEWLSALKQADAAAELPECRWSSAAEVLDDMAGFAERLPVVRGELEFQFTGTYTSNAANKRWNRRLESLLTGAEKLCAWASLHGFPYPSTQFEQAWRDLCVNQFHDIACGCCCAEADAEALDLFAEVCRRGEWCRDQAAAFMAHRVYEIGRFREHHAVMDFLPWGRVVPVLLPITGEGTVVDEHGSPVHSQSVVDETGSRGRLILSRSEGIGMRFYGCVAGGPAPVSSSGVTAGEWYLENECVRVELDPESGEICRLTDRQRGRECLPPGGRGNRLVLRLEANRMKPDPMHTWEPWHIMYTGECRELGVVSEMCVLESGPIRGRLRVVRRAQLTPDLPETVVCQDYVLQADSALLTVEFSGTWQAREAMLKAEFDLPFACTRIVADMPYGVADRAPHGTGEGVVQDADSAAENSRELGVLIEEPDRPMQKWLDAEDDREGILLLNNGKYGYDATSGCVGLSLMRAPVLRPERDEVIGLGPFEFACGVLPHAGDWRVVNAPRRGLEFNTDPLVVEVRDGRNDGAWCEWWDRLGTRLPASPPGPVFCRLEGEGVVLSVVKQSEDGGALVLRLVETFGRESRVRLEFEREIVSAVEADLLESVVGESGCALAPDSGSCEWDGAGLAAVLTPFEIRTIRVEFCLCATT
jgi:alpha-mannosidase